MLDDLGIGRVVVFQHVLDQVYAAPGAVELITEGQIGRTGCRAKSAMDA